MRIILLLTIMCVTFVGATPADAFAKGFFGRGSDETTASSAEHPGSFADLADKLLPAVVYISSTQKVAEVQDFPELPTFPEGSPFEDFFDKFMQRRGGSTPMQPPASLGSGFIIDAEKGLIVTNNHVVRDAEDVRVTFNDDVTVDAEILGFDEKTDLAVLKVKTDKKLTAVSFGDSDKLRVGDWVLAIGNPFGLGGTVTAGIVSARQRDINAGPYDDFIQTDASINRGNSGGPMFDMDGEVIGINTAIFSPSGGSVGIGFAIPSALAKPVIDQIIEYGRTRRGWLGVKVQNVTDEIAESLGLDSARGAMVAEVTPEGPAEDAGFEVGDVILEVDGKSIDEMRILPRVVAETEINSTVDVKVWRGEKEQILKVKIGELEKAEDEGLIENEAQVSDVEGTSLDDFGLSVSKISPSLRDEFNLTKDVHGLVVTVISNLSEAAKRGLLEGDVIVEINQQPVETPEDAKAIIKEAKDNDRGSVLLLINRAGDMRFVALKFDVSKKSDK